MKVDIYSPETIEAAAEHCRENGLFSVCIAQDWSNGQPAGVEYSKPPQGGRHMLVEVWASGNAKCLWSKQHYSPALGWHDAAVTTGTWHPLFSWG